MGASCENGLDIKMRSDFGANVQHYPKRLRGPRLHAYHRFRLLRIASGIRTSFSSDLFLEYCPAPLWWIIAMSALNNTFTLWAIQMIRLLEGGKLREGRWFARVNAILVSISWLGS